MTVITAEVLESQKKEPLVSDKSEVKLIVNPNKAPLPGVRRPKDARMRYCILYSVLLFTLATSVIFGYSLIQFFHRRHTYRGTCGFMMPERNAKMFESVNMDDNHELLEVPPYAGMSKGVTILHDFIARLTLIKTDKECMVKKMRSGLHPPHNIQELFSEMEHGKYIPTAKTIREHWYVIHPAIPRSIRGKLLPQKMVGLCEQLPIFELAPLDRYAADSVQSPPARFSNCPELDCHRLCPTGYMRVRDPLTDCITCSCQNDFGFCSEQKHPCRKQCPFGYIRSTDGCKLCQCKTVFDRKRRSVETKPKESSCPLMKVVFEGLAPGDKTGLAPLNYVHDCGKVPVKDGILA